MLVVNPDENYTSSTPSIVSIGNFDGVHLGHHQLLHSVVQRSLTTELPSIICTFEPHPKKIISPETSPLLLTSSEEKVRLIASYGINILVLTNFTKDFALKNPAEFVKDILLGELKAKEVWVGHDYTFGKGREGTTERLRCMGDMFGFQVHVIPPYKKNNVIVSSSVVRTMLAGGRVREACQLLGRSYSVRGTIIKGDGRGRRLGFPTANLIPEKELIPGRGVYAGSVTLDRRRYLGLINIGIAPTFKASVQAGRDTSANYDLAEVHILDFNQSIYGKEITVYFEERLRDEMRFNNPESLVKQIRKDILKAVNILCKPKI